MLGSAMILSMPMQFCPAVDTVSARMKNNKRVTDQIETHLALVRKRHLVNP